MTIFFKKKEKVKSIKKIVLLVNMVSPTPELRGHWLLREEASSTRRR
jgi:hypothetical protein